MDKELDYKYGPLRELRVLSEENKEASHYSSEQIKELRLLLHRLAPTFHSASYDTIAVLNGYPRLDGTFCDSTDINWPKAFAKHLFNTFLDDHQGLFEQDKILELYDDNHYLFFLDMMRYVSIQDVPVPWAEEFRDRFYSTFTTPGRRDIQTGYAIMLDQFGVFSEIGGISGNFHNKFATRAYIGTLSFPLGLDFLDRISSPDHPDSVLYNDAKFIKDRNIEPESH